MILHECHRASMGEPAESIFKSWQARYSRATQSPPACQLTRNKPLQDSVRVLILRTETVPLCECRAGGHQAKSTLNHGWISGIAKSEHYRHLQKNAKTQLSKVPTNPARDKWKSRGQSSRMGRNFLCQVYWKDYCMPSMFHSDRVLYSPYNPLCNPSIPPFKTSPPGRTSAIAIHFWPKGAP